MLQDRFGALWGKPAGALLKEKLFSAGARMNGDEALHDATVRRLPHGI
jgi:hypothetical protein